MGQSRDVRMNVHSSNDTAVTFFFKFLNLKGWVKELTEGHTANK